MEVLEAGQTNIIVTVGLLPVYECTKFFTWKAACISHCGTVFRLVLWNRVLFFGRGYG